MHTERVPDTGELDLFHGAAVLFALAVGTMSDPWLLGVLAPALLVGGTAWHRHRVSPRIGAAADHAMRRFFERLITFGAAVALLAFAWIAAGLDIMVLAQPLVIGGLVAVVLGATTWVVATDRFAYYGLGLLVAAGLTQLTSLRLSPFIGAAVLMLAVGAQRMWLLHGRRTEGDAPVCAGTES